MLLFDFFEGEGDYGLVINKLGYSEKLQNEKLSIKARKKYGNESSYIQQYIFFGEKS